MNHSLRVIWPDCGDHTFACSTLLCAYMPFTPLYSRALNPNAPIPVLCSCLIQARNMLLELGQASWEGRQRAETSGAPAFTSEQLGLRTTEGVAAVCSHSAEEGGQGEAPPPLGPDGDRGYQVRVTK